MYALNRESAVEQYISRISRAEKPGFPAREYKICESCHYLGIVGQKCVYNPQIRPKPAVERLLVLYTDN